VLGDFDIPSLYKIPKQNKLDYGFLIIRIDDYMHMTVLKWYYVYTFASENCDEKLP
jgi:hypothetical protein